MAIPVGAQGRDRLPGGRAKKPSRSAQRGAQMDAQTRNRNIYADQAYLNEIKAMLGGGMMGPGGGMFPGGGGGSGGGGGGGQSAYDRFLIEQEKERQRRLDQQKMQLTAGLQGARRQALPLLNKYNQQYNKDIASTFAQNRGLNRGYGQQLGAIRNQMNTQTRGTQNMLQQDLQGQGAGAPDLQAMMAASQQNMAGANFMDLLGQQYNTRLAQVMAQRQADARSMGAAIGASSKGNLENSYANLLAQIGMIGLA